MTLRWSAALLLGAALLAGCGTAGTGTGVAGIQPQEGKSGLQLTGTIDGRQFAVNDGAPVLRLGDCDVNDGTDTDLCFFTRQLDGGYFAIVIENPDAVQVGTVDVVDDACQSPRCDDVAEGAVVEVQFEPGPARTRATGGKLVLTAVEEGERYAGTLNLELPDGRLGGTFEVVPRPEEPSE